MIERLFLDKRAMEYQLFQLTTTREMLKWQANNLTTS
jgi:hypothetical protein